MAKQARIVDFEEARRSSYKRTSQRRAVGESFASESRAESRSASGSRRRLVSGARSEYRTRLASSARSGSRAHSASGKRATSAAHSTSGKRATSAARSASVRRNSNARAASSARSASNARAASSARSASSARAPKNTRNTTGGQKATKQNTRNKTGSSRLASAKREALKKKAERSYNRTVKDEAPSEGGPRAAVYKGKMGSAHKRAIAMQAGALGKLASLSLPFNISLEKLNIGRKKAVILAICTCLVVSLMLLYTPTKHYYFAVRDQAKAQVAYEIVATRSEALEKDVALLTSETGMEDRAREQYGWVKMGDNSVTVKGLSEGGEPSAAEVLRTVTLNDVRAPETWYSPFLDSVFGYVP